MKFGENAVASSSTEKSATSTISGVRRPKWSANQPKITAPSGRHISVSVIANATSGIDLLKSVAMRVTTKVSKKKSNASSDHPRKHATKVLRAAGLSSASTPLNYVLFGAGEGDGLPDGAGDADPDGDAEPVGDADGLAEGAGVLFGG